MKRHCITALFVLSMAMAGRALAQQSPANTQPPAPEKSAPAELPDAPSSSVAESQKLTVPPNVEPEFPLTRHGKLELWIHHTYSPFTLFSVVVDAGFAQATGEWAQYGGGIGGYGQRLAAALGDTEAAGFFQVFLFPSLLHQDPRYFVLGRGSKKSRALYAATRILETRSDNDGNTFNSSEVLGRLVARSLENSYYPSDERGFRATLTGTVEGIGADGAADILREFWPDLRRLFAKHAPEKIIKIEQKVDPTPLPPSDQP